ncbi:Signal transducer and activator of transcription 4 [Myotis brandtii]|uniref:Signal transducer and activator of transcription 4 n=1 Tax=Myotis brandtii TaxID=109478 RepID=S7N3G6_MYOBR|nr:Signal transducer and activator of transcription 4 [Myotis brandtii]
MEPAGARFPWDMHPPRIWRERGSGAGRLRSIRDAVALGQDSVLTLRMSQWNQVQQLEIKFLEQVDQFYDDNFPMEIRHLLAQWIENQDWEAASNNETMATILLQNLLIQLDDQLGRVSKEKNLLLIHNLKRIRKVLQPLSHRATGKATLLLRRQTSLPRGT